MTWRQRYEHYLASPKWQLKRAQVMRRCKGVCENCGEATARTVHHLSYQNLGKEPLVDLIAVCETCHEDLHLQSRSLNIPKLSADDLEGLIHDAFAGLLDARLSTACEGIEVNYVVRDLVHFANIDCQYFADLLREQACIINVIASEGKKIEADEVHAFQRGIDEAKAEDSIVRVISRAHAIAEQVMPEFQMLP